APGPRAPAAPAPAVRAPRGRAPRFATGERQPGEPRQPRRPGRSRARSRAPPPSCTARPVEGRGGTPRGPPIRPRPDARPASWQPVDLAPVVAGVLAGELVGPVPTLLARTDGACLLYPGAITALQGEPEACKGWIVLNAAVQTLHAGGTVLYIDCEDT